MKKLIFCLLLSFTSIPLFAEDVSSATAAEEAQLAAVREKIRNARDPYAVLGVNPRAETKDIKAAYKNLVKLFYTQANNGDKAATETLAKLNSANDYLTREVMDGGVRKAWSFNDSGRPTTSSSTNPAYNSNTAYSSSSASNSNSSANRNTGGMSDVWKKYYEKMAAARGPAEREALRTVQLQHVETPADFRRIISAGAKPDDPTWNAEVRAFSMKHLEVFMETKPTNGELNNLAGMLSKSPGAQRALYDAALGNAMTPAEMIRLTKPDLSGSGTGGKGWVKDFEGSFSKHAYRFYTMNPSAQEIAQFESTARVSFNKGVGDRILSDAAARAKYVMTTGKPAETYKAPGVMAAGKSFMGRMMGRFLAVDPTIVSGVIRASIEESEAKSLSAGVCPPRIQSTPKILTESYIQLFTMMSLEEQQAVIKDCGSKSAAAKKYLEDARLRILEANREKLDFNKDSLVCDSKKISYLNKKGQKVEIRFDEKAELKEIEIAPPAPKVSSRVINRPWVGNQNHRLLYKAGETANAFEYTAFNYPKDKRIDKPAKALDSETAFFLRLVCMREMCDETAFSKATGARDDSFYSITPGEQLNTPTSQKPFGEMDKDFLETAGMDMHRLLGLLRSTANQKPQAEKFCASLKDHVKVEEPMAANQSDEETASETDGVN